MYPPAEITRVRTLLRKIEDNLGLEMEAEDVARKTWGESSALKATCRR
jgi:hypothetical protein